MKRPSEGSLDEEAETRGKDTSVTSQKEEMR